jgi:hypothetical protein
LISVKIYIQQGIIFYERGRYFSANDKLEEKVKKPAEWRAFLRGGLLL